MDPTTMALAKSLLDEKRQNTQELKDSARTTAGVGLDAIGFGGDILVVGANSPDNQPDVKQAAIGGGLSGAAKGFKSGGIFGAIAGALGGATAAGIGTAQNRQDFEETDERDFEQMMSDATQLPFVGYAEEGGMSALGEFLDIVPIQAEKGETVMLADYSIADVKASKSHEEMEKGDVTDLLPKGSLVLSSDEDDSLIYKDDIDDETNLIAYKPVFYEDGDNSSMDESEKVLFTDLYKENEDALTPAELSRRIKKKYKTIDNDKDIFTQDTNKQNKESRAAYLGRLALLQEKKKAEKGDPSMSTEYVPEFRGGGVVGDPPGTKINDTLDGFLLPYVNVVGDRNFPVDWERYDKGAKKLSNRSEGRVDAIGRLIDRGYSGHRNPERFLPSTSAEARRGGPSVSPIDMMGEDQLKQYVTSIESNPEKLLKDVSEGKISSDQLQKIKQIGDPRIGKIIDDTFARLGRRLDQMEDRNRKNKADQLRKSVNHFRKKRGYNALRFGSAAAGVLGQSNREDPIVRSTGDVSEMFADTPETLIRTQENEARAGVTANNQQLEDAGASVSQIIANNAAGNSSIQGALNRTRGRFEMQRAENRSKRAQLRKEVDDYNRAQRTAAINAERTNQNRAIADLFGASANYFERGARIGDQKLSYDNAVEKEFNTNDQVLFNDRLELDSGRLGYNMDNIDMENKRAAMNYNLEQQRGVAEENENRVDNMTAKNTYGPYQDPDVRASDQPLNDYPYHRSHERSRIGYEEPGSILIDEDPQYFDAILDPSLRKPPTLSPYD